jgi:uncharacterized protein (TIGR02246 family)
MAKQPPAMKRMLTTVLALLGVIVVPALVLEGGPKMSTDVPESWPDEFTTHLNAGDLEGVMALYEPDARFVARSGDILVGRDLRQALAELIRTKTNMRGRVVRVVTVGDIALLYTDFEGSTVDATGKTVEVRYNAIEVLRRQADGAWKLIVGDPQGRKR